YLLRSFDNVERVYQMEKDGSLRSEPGQRFIAARVADGAATLAALYNAAWTSAAPTAEQVADWVKYDDFDAESRLAAPAAQSSPEQCKPDNELTGAGVPARPRAARAAPRRLNPIYYRTSIVRRQARGHALVGRRCAACENRYLPIWQVGDIIHR